MSFLYPETTVSSLDIIPGMRIADFGCGSGHWAITLAKAVGPSGTIIAIDVQESALEATRSAARHAHRENVETLRADLEAPGSTMLADASVDAVLISNMLFQADEKLIIAEEAARIVKPGGRAFLIEWDAQEQNGGSSALGPLGAQRVSRALAEQIFQKAGFSYHKEFNAGSHHYGLIFQKNK